LHKVLWTNGCAATVVCIGLQIPRTKCKAFVCQKSQVNESQPGMTKVRMLRHMPEPVGQQWANLCAEHVAAG